MDDDLYVNGIHSSVIAIFINPVNIIHISFDYKMCGNIDVSKPNQFSILWVLPHTYREGKYKNVMGGGIPVGCVWINAFIVWG